MWRMAMIGARIAARTVVTVAKTAATDQLRVIQGLGAVRMSGPLPTDEAVQRARCLTGQACPMPHGLIDQVPDMGEGRPTTDLPSHSQGDVGAACRSETWTMSRGPLT